MSQQPIACGRQRSLGHMAEGFFMGLPREQSSDRSNRPTSCPLYLECAGGEYLSATTRRESRAAVSCHTRPPRRHTPRDPLAAWRPNPLQRPMRCCSAPALPVDLVESDRGARCREGPAMRIRRWTQTDLGTAEDAQGAGREVLHTAHTSHRRQGSHTEVVVPSRRHDSPLLTTPARQAARSDSPTGLEAQQVERFSPSDRVSGWGLTPELGCERVR
jgi:hypothetical protein